MTESLMFKILSCTFLFVGSAITYVANFSTNMVGKVVFTILGLAYLVLSGLLVVLSFKEAE